MHMMHVCVHGGSPTCSYILYSVWLGKYAKFLLTTLSIELPDLFFMESALNLWLFAKAGYPVSSGSAWSSTLVSDL